MQLRVPKLHMGSEHPEAPNPLLKSQCGCGPKLLEGSEYLPNTVQGHSVVTSTQTSERSEHPEASESLSESQYNWEFPNCTWDLSDLKHPNPFLGVPVWLRVPKLSRDPNSLEAPKAVLGSRRGCGSQPLRPCLRGAPHPSGARAPGPSRPAVPRAPHGQRPRRAGRGGGGGGPESAPRPGGGRKPGGPGSAPAPLLSPPASEPGVFH